MQKSCALRKLVVKISKLKIDQRLIAKLYNMSYSELYIDQLNYLKQFAKDVMYTSVYLEIPVQQEDILYFIKEGETIFAEYLDNRYYHSKKVPVLYFRRLDQEFLFFLRRKTDDSYVAYGVEGYNVPKMLDQAKTHYHTQNEAESAGIELANYLEGIIEKNQR